MRIATSEEVQRIKRRTVPELLASRTFISAWGEWSRFRRFGLPRGKGWRAERPPVIRAIEILEQEFEDHQAEEMEKVRGRSGR